MWTTFFGRWALTVPIRRKKGFPEKDLAEKRAAIADELEDLGVVYCDALRDGWVKYLSAANPPGFGHRSRQWVLLYTRR